MQPENIEKSWKFEKKERGGYRKIPDVILTSAHVRKTEVESTAPLFFREI